MGPAHALNLPVTVSVDVKSTVELQSTLSQDLQSATRPEVPALYYPCSLHLPHICESTLLLNAYCAHSAGTAADIHKSADHRYYKLFHRGSVSSSQALPLPFQPASGAH